MTRDLAGFTPDHLDQIEKKFPAKFSKAVIDQLVLEMRARMIGGLTVDPYGGVGGIHQLAEQLDLDTLAVEIEPEFAAVSARKGATICGDSRTLRPLLGDRHGKVAAIVTSPDYGNRFADQYLGSDDEKCRACLGTGNVDPDDKVSDNCPKCSGSGRAKSSRQGYAIALGRKTDPRSGTRYQFGRKYRDLHIGVLGEALASLEPHGWLFLNVSSSITQKGYRPVMEWWLTTIADRADIKALVPVETPRSRHGANHDARVPVEHIIIARRH